MSLPHGCCATEPSVVVTVVLVTDARVTVFELGSESVTGRGCAGGALPSASPRRASHTWRAALSAGLVTHTSRRGVPPVSAPPSACVLEPAPCARKQSTVNITQ